LVRVRAVVVAVPKAVVRVGGRSSGACTAATWPSPNLAAG
jgi:hypothetical protein